MKLLLIPEADGSVQLEFISESDEERQQLKSVWKIESMALGCEEWREETELWPPMVEDQE